MTAGEIATLLLLSGATFVSEDGAGIAAGVLSAAGELPFWPAVAAVAVGIWVGDLGLWVVGRLVRRSLPVSLSDRITGRWISTRLRRHLPGAAVGILVSRFVPGTRLPVYTAAGATGIAFGGFAGWSALAVLMWTPLLVGTAAFLGEAAATGIGRYYSLALLLALAIWLVWRATSSSLPGRVIGKVRRLGRWEFWPA